MTDYSHHVILASMILTNETTKTDIYCTVLYEAPFLAQVGKPHTPTSSLVTCGSWGSEICILSSNFAIALVLALPPANSNELTGPLDACNSIWYTLRLNRMRKYILRRGTDEFFWCHEQEIELRTHSFKNGVQCSPCRGVTDSFR